MITMSQRFESKSRNLSKKFYLSFRTFQGMDVVRKIESTKTNARDKTEQDVIIANTWVEENIDLISVTKDDAK